MDTLLVELLPPSGKESFHRAIAAVLGGFRAFLLGLALMEWKRARLTRDGRMRIYSGGLASAGIGIGGIIAREISISAGFAA